MYKDNHDLDIPSDDTVMWRYLDFTKFISLLEKQALFFCRSDKLGDPFEGSIPVAEIHPEQRDQTINLSAMRYLVFVNGWHEGEFESEAMWKIYAGENNGIAIKTNFKNYKNSLSDFIERKGDVYVSRVRYIDYKRQAIRVRNPVTHFIHKRNSFKHEMEIRALYMQPGQGGKEINEEGIYYGVDLDVLIQEIVVAPFAERWFSDLVKSISRHYNLDDRVRNSELNDVPNFIRAWP